MEASAEQPSRAPYRFGMRCYIPLLGCSAIAIALQLIVRSSWVSLGALIVVMACTSTMIGCGLLRYRPAEPLPWYLLAASGVVYAVGIALRGLLDDPANPIDDLFLLAGYLVIGMAAALWLRPRQVRGNYDLLLDSALIGLGALLATWTFLISPILAAGMSSRHTLLAASYPLLDALLLALVAHSIASTAKSETSLRLLHSGLLIALLGDIGYNLNTAGTTTISPEILLTPLLVAYVTTSFAAVHPTMAGLTAPRPIHLNHSRQRASAIAVVLIVASLVPVVGSSMHTRDRVVVSSLFALLLIGVLVRSERAIVRSSRSERRAQYQADHDMLTGLLNRSALLRSLHRNHDHWTEQPLSLLFIDLDGFKRVNDSYGHAIGDELIANAASRIRRVIRRDDVAARYGGDEFVVLAALDRRGAATLAERLLAVFVRPFELSAGEIPITASIGIACTNGSGSEPIIYDLLREADSAMYHAKDYALGYVFYMDTFHSEAILPDDDGTQEERKQPAADSGRRGRHRRPSSKTMRTAV